MDGRRQSFGEVDYWVVGGTYYNFDTPHEVVKWLETSKERRQRIRVFYGDTDTGRDWMEENDTIGYIGRSAGTVKVPLLIRSARSAGGSTVLDSSIVRITVDKQDVYRHPTYHLPKTFKINEVQDNEYPFEVYGDDEVLTRFKTQKQAERWVAFIEGRRNIK